MAKQAKRLLVTVNPRGRLAAEKLARASGKAVSTVIGELLDEAAPMLEALADTLDGLRSKKNDAYRSVALALAETQLNAAQMSVDLHRRGWKPPQ